MGKFRAIVGALALFGSTSLSAQAAYVANDPVNMIDPTGMCGTREHRNSCGEETAFKAINAAKTVNENYKDLRDLSEDRADDPTALGGDHYFHCKANCEATKQGDVGESVAKSLSDLRESLNQSSGGTPEDSAADQAANAAGREIAHDGGSCEAGCESYVQETHPDFSPEPPEPPEPDREYRN